MGSLEQSYDDFPRIEEAFRAALDESLNPRGPELLYDLVEEIGLPPGSVALDVGCGEGRHSVALAERFGFAVTGIDPVPRHIELAEARGSGARFQLGVAEALPAEDKSADLVWCRDVLVLVADLDQAYAEFARVLRAGGRVLVYQLFGTDRLEPGEADWLWKALRVVPTSLDPAATDAAISAAGLRVEQRVDIGTEWGEYYQEQTGESGRRLLHAARLIRDPERYIAAFGPVAYDIMLGDCLWHVYGMIGKLERRAYVLSGG